MAAYIPLAIAAASAASSMAQQNAQAKAQNGALAQNQADAARDYQAAERERQQRLARSQAAQRAGFAASGVSADGSGAAALTNLLAESEAERDQLLQAYQSQVSSLAAAGRVNLLRQRQQWLNGGRSLAGSAFSAFSQ
ncbi:hypothetical protein [Ferrovibrio sp.]|uniref:hypothetical protein n=1 Tax=Ferrovibrio sp. TaxID=1917215 RepID=UPI001B5AF98B|nr:hypothetical protein [Ferrovibrio sp.]MBP7062752.1 hypothetical protein [Ferrovibrio sp.]